MSDWLLYHVWGIRGYRTVGMEKLNPQTSLAMLEPLPSIYRCPRCGSKDVVRKGTVSRMFLGTPVGRCRMYFEAAIPRVHCERCGITRQVRVPFAEEKSRHTRQFERYALELARITTTKHAAEHLGVAWGTVREIEARSLSRKYNKPKLKHLRQIAIDEIYIGKRMKFARPWCWTWRAERSCMSDTAKVRNLSIRSGSGCEARALGSRLSLPICRTPTPWPCTRTSPTPCW